MFDPETRKFTHATNVKFDDEVGNFEFTTVALGDDVNSDNEEQTDQTNSEEDDKRIEESSNKEELKSVKQDGMTLRSRESLKRPARFGNAICHAMLAIKEPQTYTRYRQYRVQKQNIGRKRSMKKSNRILKTPLGVKKKCLRIDKLLIIIILIVVGCLN